MAIKVQGEWRKRGGVKMKQIQSNIGWVQEHVDNLARQRGGRRGDTVREILRTVLDAPEAVEVYEVGIDGAENLTCISVPEVMYDEIEAARGDIPRGSFVRSMLAAGLRMIEQK